MLWFPLCLSQLWINSVLVYLSLASTKEKAQNSNHCSAVSTVHEAGIFQVIFVQFITTICWSNSAKSAQVLRKRKPCPVLHRQHSEFAGLLALLIRDPLWISRLNKAHRLENSHHYWTSAYPQVNWNQLMILPSWNSNIVLANSRLRHELKCCKNISKRRLWPKHVIVSYLWFD